MHLIDAICIIAFRTVVELFCALIADFTYAKRSFSLAFIAIEYRKAGGDFPSTHS